MEELGVTAAFIGLVLAGSATQNMHHQMGISGLTYPATKAFVQEMQGMHQALGGLKATNDPNKDFVMLMKPHHKVAVEMAQTYLNTATIRPSSRWRRTWS